MVYCRRPSKKCLGCRQRRIKCDFLVPSCTQCKRIGIDCTGYRDQLSLLFRDENARTAQRSAAAKDRSRGAHANQNRLKGNQLNLDIVPSISIDEQGLVFFLDRFAMVSGQPPASIKVHPFIEGIISVKSSRDTVISVGLAALSNVTGNKTYLAVALQKYVTGINIVRQAITQPLKTNPDDTIKIALILTLFEFVNNDADSLHCWQIHANGTLALLRQAHNGRMPTHPENMALMQSYLLLIVAYFNAGGDIPIEIMDWSPPNYSSPILKATSDLIGILVQFVRLSATLKDPASNICAEEVIQVALHIDQQLNNWEVDLPDDPWSFNAKESNQSPNLYQGKFHVYRKIWTSRVFNHYRWARILVNEFIILSIRKLTASVSTTHSQIEQQAQATISRMATDICISVPSHCPLLGSGLSVVSTGDEVDPPPLNGVFLLLLPLVIAGGAIGVSDELHNWVIKTLGFIASSMGVRRASQSISVVKTLRQAKQSKDYSTGISFWDNINIK